MLLGILHANYKSKRPGTCRSCRGSIGLETLHVVVVTRYGKFQQEAFVQAVRRGDARSKKAGLKYSRVHLECLPSLIIAIHLFRSIARKERKGGRPERLPEMSDEDKITRRLLVRRRADTIRKLEGTDDDNRIRTLALRLQEIDSKLEVRVLPNCKSDNAKAIIRNTKLNIKLRRVSE